VEHWIELTSLLRLDAREFYHLGQLLSFVGDELIEVGGRTAAATTAAAVV
jgi:hypothetical protein